MTVSSSTDRATFQGNGSTTIFPLPFRFFANSDIKVYLVNTATQEVTPQSYGVHFTLTGAAEPDQDGSPVGRLTMIVAPASGYSLFVARVMPLTQETDIINQGRFSPEIHENAFDRQVMQTQQVAGQLGTALSQPTGLPFLDAQGRQIKNVGTPTSDSDATTVEWTNSLIRGILETGQGPINNAENVIYAPPSGPTKTVAQALDESLNSEVLAVNTGEDQGSALVGYKGTTIFGRFKNTAHVSEWGIVGTDYQETAINEGAKLQQAFDEVSAANGTLLADARNYFTDRQLVVSGGFRSFAFEGPGTGNSQTASTAGMTLLTNGTYSAIRAEFNTFANENIRIKGMSFFNIAQDLVGSGPAIKLVRGAANSRYITGFKFEDIGINGFGAGLAWQGLNTANTGLNFFGTTICDNVSMTNVGVGFLLANASLNLLDLRSVLLHGCPYGGIMLIRDGEVGAGNGRGSSINVNISGKSHFEECGGMFRTQTTRTFGGTGTGEILRSTIRMDGLRHEFCGDTVNPVAGDPFALGVDTDLIITGDVDYGMGYGEVAYGVIPDGCTVLSTTPVRLNLVGTGRSLSPRTVNSPVIKRTIANGASSTFTLTAAQVDKPFSLKSQLLLSGGQAGFIESLHRGIPNGTKATSSNGTPTSGITAVFGSGSSGDVVSLVVTNSSGFPITAELQIENLSSCTILQPSEL